MSSGSGRARDGRHREHFNNRRRLGVRPFRSGGYQAASIAFGGNHLVLARRSRAGGYASAQNVTPGPTSAERLASRGVGDGGPISSRLRESSRLVRVAVCLTGEFLSIFAAPLLVFLPAYS